MIADLPSPLLRSFVAVAECGSLAAAAIRVGRSESALSLQMSRLEGIAGQNLFERNGRALKPNAAGGRLLSHARAILSRIDAARADMGSAQQPPIRLGMVQDFVGSVLRPTLADIRESDPASHFTIFIGSTIELLQALGEDRIDAAVCAGDAPLGGRSISLPAAWFGSADVLTSEVLPLLTITPPCPFLKVAQQALDAIGRPWRIALMTPSFEGLRAAVEAGLGIACRTVAGMGLTPLADSALPDLPAVRYGIVSRREAPREATARLAAHLTALSGDDLTV